MSIRKDSRFEHLTGRNGHIRRRYPHDGPVKIVESPLRHLLGNFSPYTAGFVGHVGHYQATRFLNRGHNCLNI